MNATTSPEARVCSAYAVPPMPPPSINVPTSKALPHRRKVGSSVPRTSCHAINNTPAHRKRVAIMKNGGKPARAKRITKYVEPQTSHVAARQLRISGESRRGLPVGPEALFTLALAVRRAVLMDVSRAVFLEAQVDIRIVPFVLGYFARADLQNDRILVRSILQVMSVLDPRLEARAITGSKRLLPGVGHEHHLAFEDVDKFIFGTMPMPLTGPGAGGKPQ